MPPIRCRCQLSWDHRLRSKLGWWRCEWLKEVTLLMTLASSNRSSRAALQFFSETCRRCFLSYISRLAIEFESFWCKYDCSISFHCRFSSQTQFSGPIRDLSPDIIVLSFDSPIFVHTSLINFLSFFPFIVKINHFSFSKAATSRSWRMTLLRRLTKSRTNTTMLR